MKKLVLMVVAVALVASVALAGGKTYRCRLCLLLPRGSCTGR